MAAPLVFTVKALKNAPLGHGVGCLQAREASLSLEES